MSIPPNFAFPITRSLGHFSLTPRPVSFSTAVLVATAVKNCSNGNLWPDSFGLRIIENHRPPFGDFHLFCPLPLPFVWTSAATTVQSGADFSASRQAVVFVDSRRLK